MTAVLDHETSDILNCPVCLEWLQPPVFVCENGHGTCKTCRKSISSCGVCRQDFTSYKNTLLDKLMETVLIKCSNNLLGCKEYCPYPEVKNHEKVCFFRKVDCLVCKRKGIDLPSLNSHFSEYHKNGINYDAKNKVSVLLCMNDWMEQRNLNRYHVLYIKNYNNSHFLVRFFYKENKDILYVCVQFLGEKQKKANKFSYVVSIDQGLKARFKTIFSCYNLCIPYQDTLDWEEAEKNEKIIPLHLKSILSNQEYASESFNIEISICRLLPKSCGCFYP